MDSCLRPQSPQQLSPEDADSLRELGLLELVEHDPRPTFILDKAKPEVGLRPVYRNHALISANSEALLDALCREEKSNKISGEVTEILTQFQNWTFRQKPKSSEAFAFLNHSWRSCVLAGRWIVVSGLPSLLDGETKADGEPLSKKKSRSRLSTFDWTDNLSPARLSPYVAWARSIDWSSTPLGPMSSWSPQLRSNASLVMQDTRPAVGFYWPELIMIYNEAYIELLGGLHPCMGCSARVVFPSMWDDYIEPIIKKNLAGETVTKNYTEIPLIRHGYVEETYFSTRFIPIFDSEGSTIGHYEPVIEISKEVVLERRSQTLLGLSQELPRARDSNSYWDDVVRVLSRNGKDVPFALFYTTEVDDNKASSYEASSSANDQYRCILRGSIGVPSASPVSPAQLDFREDHGFVPYFKQALFAKKLITISLSEGSAAKQLTEGIQWQGFGDPCREAVVCALHPRSSEDIILGFMVLGLNPRRPYDEGYSQFVLVASRVLSTTLASIVLHKEDIRRRERAITSAEVIKSELRKQLLESQKEAGRNHMKFQRFAERSDIGIFIIGTEGVYSYRNDAWFNILGTVDRSLSLEEAWGALIDDEYIPVGQARFKALMDTKQHQSFELRLKTAWAVSQEADDDGPEQQPKWVLCSIFPEISEEGKILEIIGCITEISQQKWGEKLQTTQATRAQESKRQLENFIDTTSHEMRNPLSAIVQCADSILSSHKAFKESIDCDAACRSILDSIFDSAETIVQCSKHMRTIVDDVLTLSKLDSGLFAMTPIEVSLEATARDAVRMFGGEAKSAGVNLEFQVHESCKRMDVDHVSLDPTRVLQILINLITNAIKFTRLETQKVRRIVVNLSVSAERPTSDADGHVSFAHVSEGSEALTLQSDWKEGEIVYVIISVEDTGRGMRNAEHELLFTRFSQTSPRTHIDYGGSGLGLFISKRLTEMHGGAIGLTSKEGVGSTFSFYVKSRRVKTPPSSKHQTSANDAVNVSMRTHRPVLRSRSYNQREENQNADPNRPKVDVPNSELHILIVEDNLVNQRVLAKQLRNAGMHVAVANHGGEALDYLQSTTYCKEDKSANILSLILMDWEMPVMDGLTCVANIRRLQEEGVMHGHVPIIAVTANVRPEQVETALQAGMDEVISKPFRIPELCGCIQKTLRNTAAVVQKDIQLRPEQL